MIRTVLDTNVIISGIVFGGPPRKVLELAIEARISNAVSEAILNEVKGVLSGSKFRFPAGMVRHIITELENISDVVFPGEKVDVIRDDPDDNMILECALAAAASHIVSGDSHLLRIGGFRGIRILSPAEFILIPLE